MLAAWLLHPTVAECPSRFEHKAFLPTREQREAARAALHLVPASDVIFQQERRRSAGESSEPEEFV